MSLRSQLYDAFASHPHPAPDFVRPEVEAGSDRMRDALEAKTVEDLTPQDVNTIFEGNLWMFSRPALLHYLPALMDMSLSRYDQVSVFASELIGALTQPSRDDVIAS